MGNSEWKQFIHLNNSILSPWGTALIRILFRSWLNMRPHTQTCTRGKHLFLQPTLQEASAYSILYTLTVSATFTKPNSHLSIDTVRVAPASCEQCYQRTLAHVRKLFQRVLFHRIAPLLTGHLLRQDNIGLNAELSVDGIFTYMYGWWMTLF